MSLQLLNINKYGWDTTIIHTTATTTIIIYKYY